MNKQALLVAPGNVYESILQGKYAPLNFSGFNIERINMKLINKGWQVSLLQDHEATKINVMRFFSQRQVATELLFYFCGHGDLSFDSGINEINDSKDEYLILYDQSLESGIGRVAAKKFSLTDNDLTGLVEKYTSQGIQFNLILDCCHGAGMLDSIDNFVKTELPFTLFAGSTESTLSFANSDTSFFTEALLMASNESEHLLDLKRKTIENLNDLFPDQRCSILFNNKQNRKPNFL